MVRKTEKTLQQMRNSANNVRYSDLCRVCDEYFGAATQEGTSHRVYDVAIPGTPPVNIQVGKNSKAKPYQVRQVLKAIAALDATEAGEEAEKEDSLL